MKHIAGWFRRNNTLMAQAKKAWKDRDGLAQAYADSLEAYHSIQDQLHRVARERDEERDSRLAAEAALADCLEDLPNEEE